MSGKKRTGELVIIGGHENRDGGEKEILSEFVQLAGGERARIVIMPVATQEPEELGKVYVKAFRDLGVEDVKVAIVPDRPSAGAPEAIACVQKATGIFFTGGSQMRITSILGGTELDSIIRERNRNESLVVAGTSAGASIMADSMILDGESEGNARVGGVDLGSGIGLVTGLMIDQHFNERGRIGRLISAVAQQPRYLGLGIDENTAMIIVDGKFRVIGAGSVTVCDASRISYTNFHEVADDEPLAMEGINLSIVPPGYAFDLKRRELVHEHDAPGEMAEAERAAAKGEQK